MSAQEAAMPEPIRRLPETTSTPVPIPGRERLMGPVNGRFGPPTPPAALAAGPDFPGLVKALRRRWMLALSLGVVLAAATALAAWLFLLPRYTVTSQLHVASMPPHIVFRDPEASSREALTYLKTQAARIKSRFVLNAALKKESVQALPLVQQQADPLLWLEDELRVETQENSEFVTISMMGLEPTALIALVNAVTQAYLDEIVKTDLKRKSERLAELDKIHTQLNEKVRLKKETFRKLADELGTLDAQALTQKQLNLLASYGELRKQHAGVRFECLRAEGRLKAHLARRPDLEKLPIPEAAINEAVEADPAVKQLVLRMNALNAIITDYKYNAVDPREPTRLRAERQLAELEKEMRAALSKARETVVKQLRLKAQSEYETVLAQLEKDLEALIGQRDTLNEELQLLQENAEKLGASTTDLEMLKAEIRQEDKALERIHDELHALRVELGAPPRVTLHQEAGVAKIDTKRLMLALILGPTAAFVAVCLFVALAEFRARRLQSAEEVISGLGMRLMGALPALAPRGQRHLLTRSATQQTLAENYLLESIDSIRTLLLREANVDATRVVMVTSAVRGEGKTTLASQLAGSLARAGRKTLLIDCDLRGPAVHQLFEQPLQPGFSEALLGEVHLAEAIRSTPVDGLWLLPAGQWDREVMHALARDGLEEIFDRLKGDYDFIVVDSHPVLAATDSLLISQYADAVLLSLLRDVSQLPRVYAACQRLHTLGIRILGAVVHGLRHEEVFSGGYASKVTVGR